MILWLCKSIGMAFDHLYKYPEVDVVTAANNIKKLLTLALTTSQGLSMFVHPVGKSLLIDNFDIHKWLLNPQVNKPMLLMKTAKIDLSLFVQFGCHWNICY